MKRTTSLSVLISFFAVGLLVLVCAGAMLLKPALALQQTAARKTYKDDYSSIPATSQETPTGSVGERAAAASFVTEAAPSPSPTGYVVRAAADGIAVFRAGEDTPLRTLPLDLEALPEADRQLLEEGIPAKSLAEARQILEDYR